MRPEAEIRFGRYQLHPVQGLRRGRQEIRVTPKSLALLRFLASRCGQVVTRQELFDAVWPDSVVSDAALATCIQELRQALHDDARQPRFIETIHRRGYRFVSTATVLAAQMPDANGIVGRQQELALLRDALNRALAGSRETVLVSGEPGVGKSSLLNAFMAHAHEESEVRILRGMCIEHFGAGEPYQPLLEALTRLCRETGGEQFLAILRTHAPTWLAQLPALQSPAELRALQRRTAGATPDRMLRELTDALEAMSGLQPLLLCLEDLQWSDVSTLDWIASFAHRRERACIVLIGSYRSPSPDAGSIHALTDTLSVKGLCSRIELQGLQEPEVMECIARRFPAEPHNRGAFEPLARIVHRHTEGNPLFAMSVLNDLAARGLLVQRAGKWIVQPDIHAATLRFPQDLHRVLARQLERLDENARSMLDIASIFGGACSAAAIAAVAAVPVADVESTLGALARQRLFVREAGLIEWPDGTAATGFEFVHSLYREILEERLAATRRTEFHRLAGLRLETAHAGRVEELAAELALHFDQARDARRAIKYLQKAAERDIGRSAHREAEAHLRRALELLAGQEDSRARQETEVSLLIALGTVLAPTRGFGAAEVAECYTRARDLCRSMGPAPQLFPAVWGLWIFYLARGPLSMTRELADELSRLAERSGDPTQRLQAHHAQWATQFSLGDLAAVERHAAEGLGCYDRHSQGASAVNYGGHDACACARLFAARGAVLAGRREVALREIHEAVAHSRSLEHPFTLTLALMFAGFVHQALRDYSATRDLAMEAATVAREHGFALQLQWASVLEGWAHFYLGERQAGLEQMEIALERINATGSHLFQPLLISLMAESLIAQARFAAAAQLIAQALVLIEQTGDRLVLPELHRLRAQIELATAPLDAGRRASAKSELLTAIRIAQAQGAHLLAERAAFDLTALSSAA